MSFYLYLKTHDKLGLTPSYTYITVSLREKTKGCLGMQGIPDAMDRERIGASNADEPPSRGRLHTFASIAIAIIQD